MWLENIFYQTVACFFICITLLFKDQKFLILIKSNLSIFIFWIMFLVSNMRNLRLIQSHKYFLCSFLLRLGLCPVRGAHYERYGRVALSFSHIEVPRFQHRLLPELSFLCWAAFADILFLSCQTVSVSRWLGWLGLFLGSLLSHWQKTPSFSGITLYQPLWDHNSWNQVVWILLWSWFSKSI